MNRQPIENVEAIIKDFGGTVAVAKLCDIKSPSVSEWKRNQFIPKANRKYLQALKPSIFRKHKLS